MMLTLTSPSLNLIIDPESGSYSLNSVANENLALVNARSAIRYRQNATHKLHPGAPWKILDIKGPYPELTLNGSSDRIDLICKTDTQDVHLRLSFALLQDKPLALMQMDLSNQTGFPIDVERLTLADTRSGDLNLDFKEQINPAFYSNGWQSWSPTATYGQGQKQQRTRLGFLSEPMIINTGTPTIRQVNHYSSDMFGIVVDRISRQGLLAGFLSQKQHFGSLETRFTPKPSLKLWANGDSARLDPGQSISTDWAAFTFINLDDPDPFREYLQTVKLENDVCIPSEAPLGWCSWYQYFTKVTENDLHTNLNSLVTMREALPLSLFQIDDGFESAVGDWFTFNAKFPGGVKPLAREIKSLDFEPGIWLAPFIVQSGAKILKEHSDWILRNRSGRPVNAGFGWNRLTTALDLTNKETLDYVRRVISTAAHEWGFPYLKLDFLYAAALPGAHQNPSMTRAQVLRLGLEAIREAAGDQTTLLACGCPLGSALGLFDTMRISADVAPSWLPSFAETSRPFKNEPNMPSARNAIQNILTRAYLDKVWWRNDPDCLLIRPDTKLSLDEVQSLASVIALTGGAMLLSDDLPSLTPDRLRIAQMLIPIIEIRCQVIDLFDTVMPKKLHLKMDGPTGSWDILAAFNWQDAPADLDINAAEWGLESSGAYIGRELWTGKMIQFTQAFKLNQVPAHGVRLLALRCFDPDLPCYIGSNLHISQGLEVMGWHQNDNALTINLALPRQTQGQIFLYLPKEPASILLDGNPILYKKQNRYFYELEVDFKYTAELVIHYQ
jgi:alpha-galactosidase